MEKVWRRVGLHSSRKKRDGSGTSRQPEPGSSGTLPAPREAEYQNIHTLRTADLIRQRQGEDKSTLRSSYIIRNGDNLVLVERRRRRRRRSGARAGGRHSTPPLEDAPRTEQKRRPPPRLKIFGIQWPLHSGDSRAHTSLARRFCRGRRSRDDNELYRSNSFKFERFERERPLDDSSSLLTASQCSLHQEESLCDCAADKVRACRAESSQKDSKKFRNFPAPPPPRPRRPSAPTPPPPPPPPPPPQPTPEGGTA